MKEAELLKKLGITDYTIHASLWQGPDVHVHYKQKLGFTSIEMSFKVKTIKEARPSLVRRAKKFKKFHEDMRKNDK